MDQRSMTLPHRPARALVARLATGALLLTLTACGGGAPGGSAAGSGAPGGTAAPSTPSSAGAPATVAPVPSAAAGGGLSAAGDFCLNTPEDVASALRLDGVTAEGVANPGMGGGCLYKDATGSPVYAISVVTGDMAAGAFESYRQMDGAEDVPGIGDAAAYLPLNELLGIAFRKGDIVASMAPGSQTLEILDDDAALRAALADLAKRAADSL